MAAGAAAASHSVSHQAGAQFPEVCELKVVIRSAPPRLARMNWVVDALAGDLDGASEFLDGVEYERGHMCIYLYGTDPVRLVQVTRRALTEFHLLTGTTGVLMIAGGEPAGSVVQFSSRGHRKSTRSRPPVTARNQGQRILLSDSEADRDVQRL
jgi:hypothetical protein